MMGVGVQTSYVVCVLFSLDDWNTGVGPLQCLLCVCVYVFCQDLLCDEHNRYMEPHRLADQFHCRNGTG